jgi:hypothetical protein
VPFFNGIKKKLYFSFESHFRRVPFFNGIKKKIYLSFESHFSRVPFFNGIKKKLYFSFESHFRRVPFFNGIKKKLYFSFESLWRISGSPNDVPLPFTAFLFDRWRPLSLLRSDLAKLELTRRPSRRNTPYNMDFPLQPATRCLLKLLLSVANFAYALVTKALLKNR